MRVFARPVFSGLSYDSDEDYLKIKKYCKEYLDVSDDPICIAEKYIKEHPDSNKSHINEMMVDAFLDLKTNK